MPEESKATYYVLYTQGKRVTAYLVNITTGQKQRIPVSHANAMVEGNFASVPLEARYA